MGRGVLRRCGFTAAILQCRLRVFHTSPVSDEIVGMTKFKLSSDSSSVTEWQTGQQHSLWMVTRHGPSARWTNLLIDVGSVPISSL